MFRRVLIVVLFFAAFGVLAFGHELPGDAQRSQPVALQVAAAK